MKGKSLNRYKYHMKAIKKKKEKHDGKASAVRKK